MDNLIIIGAPRAGTTMLYRKFVETPGYVYARKKELNYFADFADDRPNTYSYNKQFIFGSGQVTVEASPIYSNFSTSYHISEQIYQTLPNAKLLYLLRNPLDRLYSHYVSDANKGYSKDFLTYIKNSCHEPEPKNAYQYNKMAATLEFYINRFSSSNIKVLFYTSDTGVDINKLNSYLKYWNFPLLNTNRPLPTVNQTRAVKIQSMYTIARKLNKKFEVQLNRHIKVKNFLKYLHDSINSTTPETINSMGIGQKELRELVSFHQTCNELKTTLEKNYEDIDYPEWLR